MASGLCDAVNEILNYPDTAMQFLYCELAKVIVFNYNLHKNYMRLGSLTGNIGNLAPTARPSEDLGFGSDNDD